MRQLAVVAAMEELRIGRELGRILDRPRRDAVVLEDPFCRVHVEARRPRRNDGIDLVPVLEPPRERRKAYIAADVGPSEDRAELAPAAVVFDRDRDPAI